MTARSACVADRQTRTVPAIIGTALFMELLDGTAVMTALPNIAADLGEPALRMNLVVSLYMLALALCLPLSGWLAERFRPRRVMMAAMGLFTLASMACALADSLLELCLGRLLQGAAGAMMTPVGQVIILRWARREQLLHALSWLALPALVGPLAGPLLGGALVTWLSWQWIFLINLPICLVGCVLMLRHVPDFPARPVPPLDGRGLLLSGGALAAGAVGFEALALGELPWPLAGGLLLLSMACAWAYGRHARRHPHPLVDLDLFRLRGFGLSQAGGAVFRLGTAAQPFLLILLLQQGLGLNPLAAGWLVVSGALGALLMKPFAVPVVRRFGYRQVLTCNALISALGIALCVTFDEQTSVAWMAGVLFGAGLVRSLQFTTLGAATYRDVPSERSAAASSLSAMAVQLTLSVSISLAGLLLSAFATLQDRSETTLGDVTGVMLAGAVVCAGSAWWFRRLPA